MDFLTRLPGLTGNTEEDLQLVLDYSVQLKDEMRYYLNNLDMSNFNNVEWDNIKTDFIDVTADMIHVSTGKISIELKDMEDRVNGKIKGSEETLRGEITASASGLRVEFEASYTQLGSKIDGVSDDVSGLEGTVSTLRTEFNITAGKVSSIVSSVGSDGSVTAASIVQAINKSGSYVTISADHINLSGVTTFVKPGDMPGYLSGYATTSQLDGKLEASDLGRYGSTIIDGGRIQTGRIEAIDLIGCRLISGREDSWDNCIIDRSEIKFGQAFLKSTSNDTLKIDTYYLEIYSFGNITFYTGGGTYWEMSSRGLFYNDGTGRHEVAFR